MKILHVTPFFYPAWAYGGIPRLSYHLAAEQARQGHTVHAVTTDALDQERRQEQSRFCVEGIAVRVYRNWSNAAAYQLQLFAPQGLFAERDRIRDYDIVHIHGHRNFLNTRMAAYAHAAGVPTVMMPNGTLVNIERRQALKTIYDLLFGRRQVLRTSAWVAVAEVEKRQFVEMGIPAEKIAVIPNGVAMETDDAGIRFAEKHGLRGRYLLYLGKLTPRKGVEHLLAALPLIHDPELMIAVAGNDMGHLAFLKRQTRALGIRDRVVFTGLVAGADKAAAYRGARLTVYPSCDEIFGLVPWESILCGTPVIVASGSGAEEWVGGAGAGTVVPYGNPAAIAEAVNRHDPMAAAEAVRRGRAFWEERLAWPKVTAQMIQWYDQVVGAGFKPAPPEADRA